MNCVLLTSPKEISLDQFLLCNLLCIYTLNVFAVFWLNVTSSGVGRRAAVGMAEVFGVASCAATFVGDNAEIG